MNEVYVIAGGEWLRNNLNAIAAFMGTRTWDSIEKIALTLSVLAVAVMWVQRHNVMDLLGWVAVFVLISLLVNVRTSVQIIDNSDLVQVHRVIMCRSDWRCHFLLRPVSGMRWWSATR
ncbi:putative traG protein [Escherichia coli P0299917.1]|nr:putative traG protein [Escherichia coli P0299917.1]